MRSYNKLKRLIGRAVYGYEMLKEGDVILVAVSGGEDSLALAYFLSEWKKKMRISYTLIAVHLDMGFTESEEYLKGVDWLKRFCEDLEMEFVYVKTDCGAQAREVYEKRITSPCFVCSWHRRKHLFKLAQEKGANKIAFGHHQDDMVVTFFINMFYHGELSTILPVQEMFKGKVYLIRPLIFVEKPLIKRFVKQMGWNVLENACPFSEGTKRKQMEEFVKKHIFSMGEKVKKSVVKAIFNPRLDYLPTPPKKQ